MMHTPVTVDELQEVVRNASRLRVRGGGTKTALSADAAISLAAMSGIVEYDPSEFTFTARAGTPIREIREALALHGQYLPFDPVLVDAGATLGGTIASGLSGSGRFRFGGVRDFLLGLRFITGDGEPHSGGGKVVKNAAGFDFPKLMVGACGAYGIITEATFKVFPEPRAYATFEVDTANVGEAASLVGRLARSAAELACLDFVPPRRVFIRIGGLAESIPARSARLRQGLPSEHEFLTGDDDARQWQQAREFTWVPAEHTLVKVPITPSEMVRFEANLSETGNIPRRYAVGGNLLWLAWPDDRGPHSLRALLEQRSKIGLAVIGQPWGLVGKQTGRAFAERLASVLDPTGRLARMDHHASFL